MENSSSSDSFALIIFGVTGNLVQKYILQALYDMAEKGLLPENMSIIGNARSPMSPEQVREYLDEVLHADNLHHKHPIKPEVFEDLAKRIHYLPGNLDDPDFYKKLKDYLDDLTKHGKGCDNRMFYLATYPDLYEGVFEGLKREGLSDQDKGWVRLMIEKPFGNDLESAKNLNQLLLKYFTEDQIYRMDHYLGKETLQNILTFRFANSIFEPLINSEHVDHIQITAAEDFGIGKRGGYYDKVGALKDVGQNHLLQMAAFATMGAPEAFTNEAITAERIKILENLVPIPGKAVFGQYRGYKNESNIDPYSKSETFFALKTEIKNERFKGVPIYLRAGKMLKKTVTEISIVFKELKNKLSDDMGMQEPNILVYRIQPNEGIVLKVLVKKSGSKAMLDAEYMQYCYRQDPHFHALVDPYETLISDAIRGDQTFFNDAKEVEAQWVFVDPLIETKGEPSTYEPGSWGPKEADELIERDGRKWLEPSEQFCRI